MKVFSYFKMTDFYSYVQILYSWHYEDEDVFRMVNIEVETLGM